MSFTLLATDPCSKARRGRLVLSHGTVETPVFMPVGTQGSVKAMSPRELEELGAQMVLGNTYHLNLRPGMEVIRQFRSLHRFSNWSRPILTDSGGYQVFSLSGLRKITEAGVHFQSHLDGSTLFLGPEESMQIQAGLGSDIAMLFDECTPYPCPEDQAEQSLALTLRWAVRCRDWISEHRPKTDAGGLQQHFGIVQGSIYAELRERSARALAALDLDGYAIGGMSVGEPEAEMFRAVENSEPFLPSHKPRYAMGLGTPRQLVEMVARGVDMFDCVIPTRLARHGTAFTHDGPLNLKNQRFLADPDPIEPGCECHACQGFSRAYIRHLFRAGEILGLRLIAMHNLHFYLNLMRRIRAALDAGTFNDFRTAFVSRYPSQSNNPSHPP
ncbi:MAG: tRNA guanosine(34) transglycosylase Tgt [Verrucomicrobiales bacterium]|nr:tRNA guanosine(34) transglycosylase Tgt [Verrucomicrobiales bacterium]